ncbi:MAG TPA: peptidase S10 [Burkholderiaceae bacterium]|nr:peptidase S10 [Burkholderiaceae bacterium]
MPDTPQDDSKDGKKKREREQVEARLALSPAVSSGSVALADGRSLDYEATAEFVPVVETAFGEQRGDPRAALFMISYRATAAAGPRPVCFAFNGGPGSSSVWLHLGALGPKRVVVPDDASMPAPPYAVVDNPLTWLAHFDLVFVDPPHTGWSLTDGEETRKKMLSVDGDVEALTEGVRAWLTRHKRWGSAVYLAGESYGTTRGAALADALLSAGVALSGLVLVSCAMDLVSIFFGPKNLLPYSLFVPAFANVAQFHGRLRGAPAASPEAARAAAEAFVQEDYLAALHAGAGLSHDRRARVARRLAELTGLPRALVEERNLRVSDFEFFFELLRDEGRQVGRLDARATGPMPAKRDREFAFDPGIEAIAAPYAMAALAYYGEQLGMALPDRYELLSIEAHKAWNWNRGDAKGNAYATTSDDLARAMRRNPHLRVLVASGRYDLGTPYSATDWSLAQLDLTADVLARVEHHYYDAGHMMYTRQADLEKLARDLGSWVAGTVS